MCSLFCWVLFCASYPVTCLPGLRVTSLGNRVLLQKATHDACLEPSRRLHSQPRAATGSQSSTAAQSLLLWGPAAAGAQGPLGKESTQARTGPAAQPAEFLGGSPASLGSSPPPALPTNPASGDVNSNPETPAKCEQLGPLGPVCLSMQFYVKFISPYKSKHACTVICFLMYLHF